MFRRLAVVCAVLLLAACATTRTGSDSAPPYNPDAQAMQQYRIGVDDQLQIIVWQNPDLSVNGVPVRPDGKITVPLVGDVQAAGKTPDQVASEIRSKLTKNIRDPQVAVIVAQMNSNEYLSRVRVTGAVRQPVSIPYRRGMTVLDAVLAAGGTNDFAAPDATELYRKEGNGATQAYHVRLDKVLDAGDLTSNYPVQPGDVITVPTRAF